MKPERLVLPTITAALAKIAQVPFRIIVEDVLWAKVSEERAIPEEVLRRLQAEGPQTVRHSQTYDFYPGPSPEAADLAVNKEWNDRMDREDRAAGREPLKASCCR